MRCYCCNKILTTQESVRKFAESGAYTEMCTPCLNTISDVNTEEDLLIEDNDEEGLE